LSCHNPNHGAAHAPLGVVLALPALFAGGQASAENWEIAPRVLAGYRYSDNYRLAVPGGEIEVSGGEADAALTLRNLNPRTKFEITPRITATYFPDEPEEESTDYYLDGILEDTTPRRKIGIVAGFSSEDVVKSELPSADIGGDLGDPQSVDSGRTVQHNRRDLVRVTPYFSYDLTERYQMSLGARFLDANYEENFPGSQQDFSDYSANAGLSWRFSPRTSLTFRALAARYETVFYTDSYGGEIEWGTDFTETSQMYIRVGAEQTKPENGVSDSNVIGGIGGRWTSERNVLFIDFTREVTPISAGTVVERHQLRVRLDHDISQRIGVLVSGRASRDEELEGLGTYPTREYAAVEAGIEWRIQRALSITASYNYRWQEYDDEPSDRSANGFLIGLVYEPKRLD
jgi:hypothetical protein